MKEKDFIGGINNYCLTTHTMKERDNFFTLKSYELLRKSLFFENFCLTQDKNKKYQNWLTEV